MELQRYNEWSEDSNGDYVLYSDAEKMAEYVSTLEAVRKKCLEIIDKKDEQIAALKEEIDRLINTGRDVRLKLNDDFAILKAENTRLREALAPIIDIWKRMEKVGGYSDFPGDGKVSGGEMWDVIKQTAQDALGEKGE